MNLARQNLGTFERGAALASLYSPPLFSLCMHDYGDDVSTASHDRNRQRLSSVYLPCFRPLAELLDPAYRFQVPYPT